MADKRQTYTKNKPVEELVYENTSEGIDEISDTQAYKLVRTLQSHKLLDKKAVDDIDTLYKSLAIVRSLSVNDWVKMSPNEDTQLFPFEAIVDVETKINKVGDKIIMYDSVKVVLDYVGKVNWFANLVEQTEGYLFERTLEHAKLENAKFVEFCGKGCVICNKPAKLVTNGQDYQVICANNQKDDNGLVVWECANHNMPMPTKRAALSNWQAFREVQDYLLS